jgi:hypothetical protein
LLSAITDNEMIKKGLFHSTGGNMSTLKGWGKTKTDWHYEICVTIFSDHKKYGQAFQLAKLSMVVHGMVLGTVQEC